MPHSPPVGRVPISPQQVGNIDDPISENVGNIHGPNADFVGIMPDPRHESRMWLSRGGDPLAQVCLYGCHERRNGEYPRALLEGCRAYLQTDGFEVDDQIAAEQPGITLVGCWAHARRRFHDTKKASKKAGAADEGMKYIRRL
jgi:hypothetical protein